MPRPGAGPPRGADCPRGAGRGASYCRGVPNRRCLRLWPAQPAAGDPLPARRPRILPAAAAPGGICLPGQLPGPGDLHDGTAGRWGGPVSSSTASWMEKTCPWRWNTIWFPPGQGSGCGSLRRNGGCSIWGRKPPSISCPTRRSRAEPGEQPTAAPRESEAPSVPDRLPGRSRTAGGSSAGQRLCC